MRDMRLFVLHLQIFFEHTLFKGLVCAKLFMYTQLTETIQLASKTCLFV